jgi:uncharacterized protein YegP (UPF0339 family)
MAEFNVVRNRNGKIEWLFAQSGSQRIIAKSWEEYDSVTDCMNDIELLKEQIRIAEVNDDVKPIRVKKKNKRFSLFGRSSST